MEKIDLEIAARKYCDRTGSMYFEYTDASNELIDAFEAGAAFAEKQYKKSPEKECEHIAEIFLNRYAHVHLTKCTKCEKRGFYNDRDKIYKWEK